MKLLYIDPWIPYPLTSGGNQAFFMMADHVRKYHELSLLLHIHHNEDKKHIEALKKLWPDVTFYVFDDEKEREFLVNHPTYNPYNGMSRKDTMLSKSYLYVLNSMQRKIARKKRKYDASNDDFVRSNSTLFMESVDLTPSFCSYVSDVCSQGFDIVQVEFFEYLPLVYAIPQQCKKVFVHHELRFIRNEIEVGLFKNVQLSDTMLLQKKKEEELAALSAYDAVVTLTDIDRDILKEYLPEKKLFTSPAITQTVALEHLPFKPVKDIVFVGNSNHFPNVDGMVWFCSEIVPILKEKGVQVPTIYATGNWDARNKKILTELCPEVAFPGFIDDLQSFLNGKLSIVPIRIGSGMRMKLIDTACAAAPIVTTSKGCEGLPFVHEKNCLKADTPEDFANAVARLLADQNLQKKLAINAQNAKTTMLDEQQRLTMRLKVYENLVE
jgi:glycosyltransferase involved in cell wall biosynthesis